MKTLLIAAAIVAAPLAASAAGLSGAWTINGSFDSMGIKYAVTCTLADAGGKLSGPCKGPQGEAINASGSEGAGKFDLAYDTTYMGSPVHLDYKGDIKPDGTVAGTIDAGAAQGAFTAARQ